MSQFIGQLILRALYPDEIKRLGREGTQLYEQVEDFGYQSNLMNGLIFIAPKGRITDLASIPRPVWSIIDPEDPIIMMPSVMHDARYGLHDCTKDQADAMLREGMEVQGAGSIIRNIVFQAVQRFGGSHWKG